MSENAAVEEPVLRQTKEPISRRALLAGGAGLVGAAAAASGALAQQAAAPAAPGMPAVQAPVRQDWLDKRHEEIIEPALPIVDPHHHLWDRPNYRYLFPELLVVTANMARAIRVIRATSICLASFGPARVIGPPPVRSYCYGTDRRAGICRAWRRRLKVEPAPKGDPALATTTSCVSLAVDGRAA
jgi:hypothetical protein